MDDMPMTLPTVPIHKMDWNGTDCEVSYTASGEAVDCLRTLLGRFGFLVGTLVTWPDSLLEAQSRWSSAGCILTELQDVCRNDPGVEFKPRQG